VILERTAGRIAHCSHMMDAQMTSALSPGRRPHRSRSLCDGDLDLGPRRQRFYQEAPKMAGVVQRVDQDPRLVDLWADRQG
jgi:GST-like protein